MSRRSGILILSIIIIAACGGLSVDWLHENCPKLSPNNCQLMWGTAFASMMGGVLLVEFLIAHKKAKGKSSSLQAKNERRSGSPHWYVWIRPVAWVTLSALLAGLPLTVQGAYGLILFGTATGMFFNVLFRAIVNRLPPLEKDGEA